MEAPQEIVLPEEVSVISYCALDSAHRRPARGYRLAFDFELSALSLFMTQLVSDLWNDVLCPMPFALFSRYF
jgi:hypothetical protein